MLPAHRPPVDCLAPDMRGLAASVTPARAAQRDLAGSTSFPAQFADPFLLSMLGRPAEARFGRLPLYAAGVRRILSP